MPDRIRLAGGSGTFVFCLLLLPRQDETENTELAR